MRWYSHTEPATLAFEPPVPETMAGRVAGVLVAVGVFLSIDIVVVHWIFRLHRVTGGPEANVIEPILVAAGAAFVIYGLRRERRSPRGPGRGERGPTVADFGQPHAHGER